MQRHNHYYGKVPDEIGVFDLEFEEYMHYMYLPIYINESGFDLEYQYHVPPRLSFAQDLINAAFRAEEDRNSDWKYVYVTARRGYATPGNPLNRPGWHADGFGTDDINYVWTDRYPTLYAVGEFEGISDDHVRSTEQFEGQIALASLYPPELQRVRVQSYPDKTLLRLDDSVIHRAPDIPAPGGERSFFKVSFSDDRYNLKGNSHNYGLSYDWTLFDREQVRNDPARAGKDSA